MRAAPARVTIRSFLLLTASCFLFIGERRRRVHGLSVIHLARRGHAGEATWPSTNNGAILEWSKVDWVYEEELETRSNYFWSPDSTHIAYLQMDEGNVPESSNHLIGFRFIRQSISSGIRSRAIPIPRVRVGVGQRWARTVNSLCRVRACVQERRRLHSSIRMGRPEDGLGRDADARPQASQYFYYCRRRNRAIKRSIQREAGGR